MQLTFSSFLGENRLYKHLSQLESRIKLNDTISKLIKEHAISNSSVLNTIVDKAKQHKTVMINENHFYPNHRILIYDLLETLKDIAYTHLALEALDTSQDSLLNLEHAYPTLKTGFYTSEQNYGHVLR